MGKLIKGIKILYIILLMLGLGYYAYIFFPNLYETQLATLIEGFLTLFLIYGFILFLFRLIIGIIRRVHLKGDNKYSKKIRNQIITSLLGLLFIAAIWAIIQLLSMFYGVGGHETYISAWRCPKEARYVIESKKLDKVHSCEVFNSKLGTEEAKLVYLQLGPANDCMSGCIYAKAYHIIQEENIIDMPMEPRISTILAEKTDKLCEFDNFRNNNWKNITRFATIEDENIYWTYEFNNFTTENYFRKNAKNNKFVATIEYPKICILNGTLIVKGDDHNNILTGTDNLTYELLPLQNWRPESFRSVLNDCIEQRWDPSDCFNQAASARGEPELCFESYSNVDESIMTPTESCLKYFFNYNRDIDYCNQLDTQDQKDRCNKVYNTYFRKN